MTMNRGKSAPQTGRPCVLRMYHVRCDSRAPHFAAVAAASAGATVAAIFRRPLDAPSKLCDCREYSENTNLTSY
jgi:hypothetical protein